MRHFLYIRGNPGVGKITVARILEKELGWKVVWFHDLKNAIYNIVKEHRIPRLMDEVTQPVIGHLLSKGESVIYTRCSPDKQTVEGIQQLVAGNPEYKFTPVLLTASYDTLVKRVSERNDPFRISSKEDLDDYINGRATTVIEGELVINTDGLTPSQIAAKILGTL
ncbi:MAG TPA: AAA family ATPase [Candidatus Saccharimonadales bacterium]|nr:AAA family ATPase [Candidatus Saccharimonadales bacterium]